VALDGAARTAFLAAQIQGNSVSEMDLVEVTLLAKEADDSACCFDELGRMAIS
jgi:hypothetical protein